MVTPVIYKGRCKFTRDASGLGNIADDLGDRILGEVGIDSCVAVSISLTEFEFGVKSVFVLFIGDHAELVHLAQDDPHSSLRISSACLSQRIVVRGALGKSCNKCALGQCEFGSVFAEIVHCGGLYAYEIIAHRGEVDV